MYMSIALRSLSRRLPRGRARSYTAGTLPTRPKSLVQVPNPIPNAGYYRGGTSKGIFLDSRYLPEAEELWPGILNPLMGSPDSVYKRQLNGMGGGVSSLSKAVVVSPSSREGIDCEYTFVQVGIDNEGLDLTGNCGNLSSVAGIYSVDAGICKPRIEGDNRGRIRSWNTNTNKVVDTVFPLDAQGRPNLALEEIEIAGVLGKASAISLEFLNPAGARTGKLLPTGNAVDVLELPNEDLAEVSLVDATNPTVILPYHELRILLSLPPMSTVPFEKEATLKLLETIRTESARRMSLPPAAAQPKIAVVQAPSLDSNKGDDIVVRSLSMGILHKTIPMTVGLCIGVAAGIKGTVVERMVKRSNRDSGSTKIRLQHPGGTVEVGSTWSGNEVVAASVIRSGRRLMQGNVFW